MVVIQTAMHCRKHALLISDEVIAARLQKLAEIDSIEGIGDLRMWGNSEVRLK